MRAVLGTTPQALARRGIGLDRLAVLTLRQDAHAATPGPTLPLWLGERTQYRPAAWLLDTFDRAMLGGSYAPWGATGVRIVSGAVVPDLVASGPQVSQHATVLPRDQWASGRITALSGAGAIGVGLRLSAGQGYVALALVGSVVVRRYRAGALEANLTTLPVPWQLGDILACSVEWNRVRLYRNGTLITDLIDANPILTAGQAGPGGEGPSGATAGLDEFVAGPWRQEYIGALADLGDVAASLGLVEPTASPASWNMTVINVAPLGGAARFSALLRHGVQVGPNTYDLARAPVTLSQAIQGGSAPLSVVQGKVSHQEALTESTVRLVCAGRDAFLTPAIEPGLVTYLPGANPILTAAPVPVDPCGADAVPTVVPGSAPPEPAVPAAPAGIGPEAPGGDKPPALMGAYRIAWDYTLAVVHDSLTGAPIGQAYTGSPAVTVAKDATVAIPDGALGDPLMLRYLGDPPGRGYHWFQLKDSRAITASGMPGDVTPSQAFPYRIVSTWFYRGPDIVGSQLVHSTLPDAYAPFPSDAGMALWWKGTAGIPTGQTVTCNFKVYRHDPSGIHSDADLSALRPRNPGESNDPMPPILETLADHTVTVTGHSWGIGGYLSAGTVPLGDLAGPSLIRLEVVPMPDDSVHFDTGSRGVEVYSVAYNSGTDTITGSHIKYPSLAA